MSRKGNNIQKTITTTKQFLELCRKSHGQKLLPPLTPAGHFGYAILLRSLLTLTIWVFHIFFLTLGWWSPQTMSGFAKIHPRIKFVFFLNFRQKILRKKCPVKKCHTKKCCAKNVLLRIELLCQEMSW